MSDAIKVNMYKREGRWVASVWGKGAAVVRPVPGNARPARVATWATEDEARLELPVLLGAPVEVVRVD